MAQALVLNATFEPLTVVPIRRAVVLLVRNKAELLALRERTDLARSLATPHTSHLMHRDSRSCFRRCA